jgi:hypothetical protein
MRNGILRSVAQNVGLVPSSRKPFQSTPIHSNSTIPPLQNLSSNFFTIGNLDLDLDLNVPLSFTSLFSSPDFLPCDLHRPFTPNPSFPAIGGYFLLWPIYVAAVTRVSHPIHCIFAINVLNYIGENMGIRQASNMASFLQAHPAFMGKGKESGVMGEINGWKLEAPIQPLREIFEREEREQEQIMATLENLVRRYRESEGESRPGIGVEETYRHLRLEEMHFGGLDAV